MRTIWLLCSYTHRENKSHTARYINVYIILSFLYLILFHIHSRCKLWINTVDSVQKCWNYMYRFWWKNTPKANAKGTTPLRYFQKKALNTLVHSYENTGTCIDSENLRNFVHCVWLRILIESVIHSSFLRSFGALMLRRDQCPKRNLVPVLTLMTRDQCPKRNLVPGVEADDTRSVP